MKRCVTRWEQDWAQNPPIGGDSVVNTGLEIRRVAAHSATVVITVSKNPPCADHALGVDPGCRISAPSRTGTEVIPINAHYPGHNIRYAA